MLAHVATPQPALSGQVDVNRIIRPSEALERTLKIVSLPKECLPRFLAIAKVNTEMNRETCGLLLGKDKGYKYVVTTLLIPKQHSTSDTCTMDEEELVLQFTEERSLITLGWVCWSAIHYLNSMVITEHGIDTHTPFTILFYVLSRPSHPFRLSKNAPRIFCGRLCSKIQSQVRVPLFKFEREWTFTHFKLWYIPPHRPTRPSNDSWLRWKGSFPPSPRYAHLHCK